MLGDLGYDDTFLESPIKYPVMTNIIFLLLVTCISGFIINLVIAQPADYMDKFRERAVYHKLATRINLFIKLDFVFEFCRRRSLLKKGCTYEKQKAKPSEKEQSLSSLKGSFDAESFIEAETQDNQTLKLILERLERIEMQLAERKLQS